MIVPSLSSIALQAYCLRNLDTARFFRSAAVPSTQQYLPSNVGVGTDL